MNVKSSTVLCGFMLLAASGAHALDAAAYSGIGPDLANGRGLADVAARAHEHSGAYWTDYAGPEVESTGGDANLSAGEAVAEIYRQAASGAGQTDPLATDIVSVTLSVVDAWPDCTDTFDAVRSAVSVAPARSDEIVAAVAVKKNCNCSNGGIWVEQRLDDRLRVEMRHAVMEMPYQCSCSQVAMYAGMAGLPEVEAYAAALPDEEKARLVERIVEKLSAISEKTTALQSRANWECGCADVNIAAAMQGISPEAFRDSSYHALTRQYVDEAADTGVVIDSFGVVGTYPPEFWGDERNATRNNSLIRKPEVYRGDRLVFDPFDPAAEFVVQGNGNFADVGRHEQSGREAPTDLIISQYVEGAAGAAPAGRGERDASTARNRALELYNGTQQAIDLGDAHYLLEIYAASGERGVGMPRQIVGLSGVIEPADTFVIAFDGSEMALVERADLVTAQLDFQPNDTLVIRRFGGQTEMNCKALGYAHVVNYPPVPPVRPTGGPLPCPAGGVCEEPVSPN